MRVPREQIADPVSPSSWGCRWTCSSAPGQLAINVSTDAAADGIRLDCACGDEVSGSCTELREFFEADGQAYVLRVPSNFTLTLAAGTKMTCAEAVTALLKHPRRWEVRSAGHRLQGRALVRLGLARHRQPARHHLLIRRHLRTGELAFHYCCVPDEPAPDQGPADPGSRAALAG